jgi:hypothetical protein
MRLGSYSLALLCPLLSVNLPFAAAETFESLTYSPPNGWAVQDTPEGRVYVGKEPNGTGNALIALYTSQPGTASASQAFAAYWRTHVEKVLPGPPPEPKIGREGDFTLAAGTKQATPQGPPLSATIVAFTGRGRVFGVMGIASGQEMGRAVLAFVSSLRLNAAAAPGAPATAAPPAKIPTAGEPEMDFDLPPRYAATREGANIVISPLSNERPTPCTFIIGPPRPSKGSLEADAESALLDLYPGWQRMDTQRRVMKGTSATGWPYVWNTAHIWQGASISSQRTIAMAMVLPAGPGRVHTLWGRGTPLCTYDDASFAKLFLGLRPRGWVSDEGKALSRGILGTWRWTSGLSSTNAMMQYTFTPDGRFVLDSGSTTQLGVAETTATNTRGGRYTLKGTEITLARDNGASKVYRIRLYEELLGGAWNRVMSLFDEKANPPATVEYYRVD